MRRLRPARGSAPGWLFGIAATEDDLVARTQSVSGAFIKELPASAPPFGPMLHAIEAAGLPLPDDFDMIG